MEAKLCSVTQNVINGSDKFFVPAYQRPYRWKTKEVDELIDDIWESAKAKEKEYFIGSIICIKPNDSNEEYEIVDGQQRLITLTLILLELARLLEKKSPKTARQVRELVMREEDLGNYAVTPTLRVRKEDDDFYQKYILGDEKISQRPETSSEKTFINNKKAVKKKLGNMQDEEIEIFTNHLRKKLKVVFVETEDLISSYRLFNVLNNRGLPLNDSDLIKNELLFVAHGQNGDNARAETVERNWLKMENLVGEDKLNDFLALQIVSEKKDRDRAKGRSRYVYFKAKLESHKGDSVKVSGELLHSAENRQSFREGDISKEESIRFLKLIAKPSDWEPAFMAFLNRDDLREEFPAFVRLFEKIYMHCFLGGELQSQGEAACYHAVEAINNGKEYSQIASVLAGLAQSEKLENALDSNRFYDPKRRSTSRIVKAILLRVEDSRRDKSFNAEYALSKISVEHVLPQDMSNPYWKSRFSPEEHADYCHKLGNLTLLLQGKNSTARNLGFDEKKQAYQKAKEKPLEITKELCDLPEWNLYALKTRHENLKKEILDLWKITSEDSRKDT